MRARADRPGRSGRGVALVVAALVLWPAVAEAHGTLDVGDFYAGVLLPVFHPDALLVVLAMGLLSGQQPETELGWLPGGFLAGAAVGSVVALAGVVAPALPWLARACAFAAGVLVAVQWAPAAPLLAAFGAATGIFYGYAGTVDELTEIARPVLYVPGLLFGAFLVVGNVIALMLKLDYAWARIGFRVVGSWIAAVALLVSALAFRGGAV